MTTKLELHRKLSDQGRGLVRSGLNSSTHLAASPVPPPVPQARADKSPRVVLEASEASEAPEAPDAPEEVVVSPSPVVAPPGTTVILCAGTSFVVETRLFSQSRLLASALPLPDGAALHLSMDAATVKLALRLLRDLSVEPSQRTNRAFLERCARCAREFGMPDALQQELSHRVAASASIIMPEVAALLETNPRRKVLLYKQVVRKARMLDITTGGARAAMAKQGRLKVAEALLDAAAQPAADAQARAQYAHYAARLLDEGQNAQLPAPVAALQSDLRARLGALAQPVKAALVPPPLFSCTYASGEPPAHGTGMVRVNAGGQLAQSLHTSELLALPCVARLLPLPPGHDAVFVGDDAERFQLALHLLRVRGRLEPGEKADLALLASYLDIARRYALAPALVGRVEAWVRAHKHGLGGARDAKEEIRGLKLTRALNPERGDMLVSSALAEAYLEQAGRAAAADDAGKRARLLAKAEAALRTVLPVLVTSMSVTRADAEQKQAVSSMVRMLKDVLVQAGRPAEAQQVDASVRAFEQGIAASADDIARANRQRQQPVEGMYS